MKKVSRRYVIAQILCLVPMFTMVGVISMPVQAALAKQVHLIVKSRRLIASNIRTSRFQEFRLKPNEVVSKKAVGDAVIIVITNQRIIAYGVSSGWRDEDLRINEEVEQVEVADYAALVVTNKRLVNFNGLTGAFGRKNLPIGR